MQTLSHSQAHTQGPWSCVPGKFFIVYSYVDGEPIAVPKTEANGALKAISTITMTPERVAKLITAVNDAMEFDGRYAIAQGHYEMRLAVLECMCRIDSEVTPEGDDPSLDDLASLARRVV